MTYIKGCHKELLPWYILGQPWTKFLFFTKTLDKIVHNNHVMTAFAYIKSYYVSKIPMSGLMQQKNSLNSNLVFHIHSFSQLVS